MIAENVEQKIQLIKGEFTPSEASDVINALIKEKINFHKIQRWTINEKCETSDTGHLNNRILELLEEKESAAQFIAAARREGKKISIQGKIELSFSEE